MFTVEVAAKTNKKVFYESMFSQLEALLSGEDDLIAVLANVSALLNQCLDNINWVGFYLMKENELLLGPFQGKVACMHIQVGKGVCGHAVASNETVIVPDVHAFPGHIACDAASRSEIVVPLRNKQGEVVGVLDIDSPICNRFDAEDGLYLEKVNKLIESLVMK